MPVLAIITLCIASAVVYGIVHDQVTARVYIEYFTVGHPPIFHTDSPTLLGIGRGIIATWWVGLLLGIPLAIAARSFPGDRARSGRRAPPTWPSIVRSCPHRAEFSAKCPQTLLFLRARQPPCLLYGV